MEKWLNHTHISTNQKNLQQSHVESRVWWNLLSNASNFVLLKKNLENKDFASPTQIFKLLSWAPKIAKTYIILI